MHEARKRARNHVGGQNPAAGSAHRKGKGRRTPQRRVHDAGARPPDAPAEPADSPVLASPPQTAFVNNPAAVRRQ